MKRRYESIADLMDMLKWIEENGRNLEAVEAWRKNTVRQIRDKLKRIDRDYPDPLAKPMWDGWRSQIDEDGEGGCDYRILRVENPDDWTDEDIDEYIMSEVGYPPICGPYDCTGKRFTRWVSFKRTPAGITMIHDWGLDV